MAAEFPIPQKYSATEIRVCVLISLTLQIFLIFLAPLRKNRATRSLRFVIWSCYLLADWIADFGLGLLLQSNSPSNGSPEASSTSISLGTIGASTALKHGLANNTDTATTAIQGFWAPFLLLHLGGPDSITALALEDNELWLRHFLGLAFELFATIWVLAVSLRGHRLIPIGVIMLLVGVAKYTERTFCLYRGSKDGFRAPEYSSLTVPDVSEPSDRSASSNQFEGAPEYSSFTGPDVSEPFDRSASSNQFEDKLKGQGKRATAYLLFNSFRHLFFAPILGSHDRAIGYKCLVYQNPSDAFEVIEIELNFVYDVLYTKAVVIHTRHGYALRLLSSAGILSAFLVFFFIEKNDFSRLDVAITYALLIGAMALDATALTMLLLSDWTRVFLKDYLPEHLKQLDAVLKWCRPKRWSGKISQMNLIDCCIGEPPEKKGRLCNFFNSLCQLFCLTPLLVCPAKGLYKLDAGGMLTDLLYVHHQPVKEKLKKFIFEECMDKSPEEPDYEEVKKICELRGARALNLIENVVPDLHRDIIKTVERDFDESLLLWHIATEICYSQTLGKDDDVATDLKAISKSLSDYMLYLLVLQPTVLSMTGGIGLIRYRDTCTEARGFFNKEGTNLNHQDACRKLLHDYSENMRYRKPAASVLSDACIHARNLRKLRDETVMWRVIAGVWGELLAYAACHCQGMVHARLLSRGGELITMVWLMMAHLGLGDLYFIRLDLPKPRIWP